MSVEKFERIEFPKPEIPEVKQEIAPYNGFGSVEDSLASCLNLIPKAPRRYSKNIILKMTSEFFFLHHGRDFIKFMQKDRDGLNSNVLRFVAKLDTTRPIDMDRRFIVFYHLSDDTIAVFEPPQRNSGEQTFGHFQPQCVTVNVWYCHMSGENCAQNSMCVGLDF